MSKTKRGNKKPKSFREKYEDTFDPNESEILDELSLDDVNDASTENSTKHTESTESIDCMNPIDKLAMMISDKISPIFQKMNYTPNGLTIISVIFSIASIYNLSHGDLPKFTGFVLLSYLFNRTNDLYAKKYGFSEDPSNDEYGRFKDLLTLVMGTIVLYKNYDLSSYPELMIITCALFVLNIITVGCEKRLCTAFSESRYIDRAIEKVTPCKETCKNNITFLKYLGPASLTGLLIGTAWYLNSQQEDAHALINEQTVGVIDVPFGSYQSLPNDQLFFQYRIDPSTPYRY